MKRVQELILKLQRELCAEQSQNSVELEELQKAIIRAIIKVPLPETPPDKRHDKPDDEDKIEICYLSRCGEAGIKICTSLLEQDLIRAFDDYHSTYALAGVTLIGNEIGMEYGRILYPKLRELPESSRERKLLPEEIDIKIY